MQRLPRTGTLTPRQMVTTGAALLNVVRGRTQAMAPDQKSEPKDSPVQDRAHRGLDGVYVELGSTWQ